MEKAREEYETAVRIAPSYDAANANLGAYYANHGDFATAIKHFQDAVRVNPFMAGHRVNLGSTYMNMGKFDEAEAAFRKSIELAPERFDSYLCLGGLLYRKGRLADALVVWQEMLDRAPDHVELLNQVAWLLATHPDASIRNGKKALELAKRANELTQDQYVAILNTLAAAYAETGDFTLAIEKANKAVKIAMRINRPDLAQSILAKIALYEDNKPYREVPPAVKEPPPKK
jgi:tetratricopeptide (TPR) repeat protein